MQRRIARRTAKSDRYSYKEQLRRRNARLASARSAASTAMTATYGFPGRNIRNRIANAGGAKERKVFPTSSGTITFACDTTGTLAALNVCAVGDDYTNRDGRQVKITSVFLRGAFTPAQTPWLNNHCRIILFLDKQHNSTTVTTAAMLPLLLDSSDAGGITSYTNLNLSNRNRFQILKEIEFTGAGGATNAVNNYSGSPTVRGFKKYLKLDIPVTYSGSAGADTSTIANNVLYMLTIGSVATGSGHLAITAIRTRFVDV